MTFESYLVLSIIQSFKGERSLSAIYHLLRGKKSAQTIQDSLFYNLSPFFQTMTRIELADLQSLAKELRSKGFIRELHEAHYLITQEGIRQLEIWGKTYSIPPELNGLRYGDSERVFWPRLSVTIQTISHLMAKTPFVPITNDALVLDYVKSFLKDKHRKTLASSLYRELFQLLDGLPESMSQLFIMRLTGSHRVGYTLGQAAKMCKWDPLYCHILFQAVLHHIMEHVNNDPRQYLMLYQLMDNPVHATYLTQSTTKTLQLLGQGASIEKIAVTRALKLSTIEDHLVEIALHDPHFDITPYVPSDLFQEIKSVISQLKTHRLKMIKEQLSEDVSYFQIRLVLAKGVKI